MSTWRMSPELRLDGLAEAVAVLRAPAQRLQDQEVERALQ